MSDNQNHFQQKREGSRPGAQGKGGASHGYKKGGQQGSHKGGYQGSGKGGYSGQRKGSGQGGQWKKDGRKQGDWKSGERKQGDWKPNDRKPGGRSQGGYGSGERGPGGYRQGGRTDGKPGGYKQNGYKSGERKQDGFKSRRDGERRYEGGKGGFAKKDGERRYDDRRDGGKPRFDKNDSRNRSQGFDKRGGKPSFDGDRRSDGNRRFDGKPGYGNKPRFDNDRRDGRPQGARDGFKGPQRDRNDRRDGAQGQGFRKEFDRKPFDAEAKGADAAERPERFERRDFERSGERRSKPEGQRSSDTKQRGFVSVQRRTPSVEDLEKEPRLYAGRPDEGEQEQENAPARELRDSKATPARLVALQVGRQARERDAFVHDLLEARFAEVKLSPEDRAFASLLALGVAQTRGTLDEIINRAVASPDDIKPRLRDALRVSTYEIIFLDKASHAAVDQGVELARAAARNADRLANAVLHRIVAMREQFPFGDPKTDLGAFARQHAFPAWLADLLVRDLGMDAARDLMAASNEPAPLFVSVNALRATDEEVAELLTAAGATVTPVELGGAPVPGCLRVSDGHALVDGRVRYAIKQGKLLVSDAASQAVAQLVLDSKPSSLLEVGAGRATKTILLQSGAQRRFGRQLKMVTLDNRAFKTKLLKERANAYGARVDEALVGDATDLDAVVGTRTFGTVFIDAPCSGLGTLRRHPEIRWRLEPGAVERFAETGAKLLRSAAPHVEPGGTLVYATCTITRAENNDVVAEFLKSPEGQAFSLQPVAGKSCFATRVASGSSDAHFAVRLVRDK